MRCFQENALGPVENKAHTKMSSYSTLPCPGHSSWVNDLPQRKGPCQSTPVRAETQDQNTPSQIHQGITIKGIPARGSCCCLCLWLKIFLVIFLSLPCFPHSDKHPNKATTSSNCPGISIASSLHDLSTFNSNFILTVPKIAKEYHDATPQLRNTD